jgi:hypothetical protein
MASPQRLLSGAPLTVGTSTNAALSLGDCSTVSVEIDASNNTDSTDQTIVNVNGSNDGVDWNPLATITLAQVRQSEKRILFFAQAIIVIDWAFGGSWSQNAL